MKQTVIQCVTAIICVVAICVTSVIAIGNIGDAKVEVAGKVGSSATGENGQANNQGSNVVDPISDTASDTTTDLAGEPVTDNSGAVITTPIDGNTTTDGKNTSTTTTSKSSSGLTTKEQIASYYSTAINKVIAQKAGYKKTTTTSLSNLEGGALLKMKIVVDTVNDFLGVGTKNYTNTKGKKDFLSTADIKASDIKSATCASSGGVYTISIALNDGTSSASSAGTTDTSALGRSGLYAGKGDKIAFDYKNSSNIYTGINNVDNASVESVKETVSATKIVAKVNVSTGNIISLSISYDWSVVLTNVKYILTIKSASGNAKTSVSVSNFQW